MNAEIFDHEKHLAIDHLNWLSQRVRTVTEKQELYFCNVVKDALTRGWALVYARHYALGKLIGVHWVMRERPVGLKPLYGVATIAAS